jgi:enoyl-CoA hydratase/carnithine racemase
VTVTETAAEPLVFSEVRDHVALLTINRPNAMNAINSGVSTAMGNALEEAQRNSDVRAIVITGNGRAFCAGADLKELAQGKSVNSIDHPEWDFAGLVRHWVDKPLIAAVNGFALGGGTEIVLACDLAVIDETASLGLPEVARGLFAAAGGVLRLQRQVPQKVAAEIVLTGVPISATRAFELGLVNRVAPRGMSVAIALELAATIAANGPLALRTSKKIFQDSLGIADVWSNEVWRLNYDGIKVIMSSKDAIEGATAFAEKRSPVWTGE